MSARLVLPPDAPKAEWLAARRQGVTASEIAVLLGISPYDSPFNLYFKKRGELGEDFDNDRMSLGRHLEPWIADQWADSHPEFNVGMAGLFVSGERPYQMATPDRLLYDPAKGHVIDVDIRTATVLGYLGEPVAQLEIKSSGTYDGWGEDGTDQIPAYYRAQVLWQLDTLDLPEAHVTCWFKHADRRRDYVIAYDVADVHLMRTAALDFLGQVERGEPPAIDWHPATTAALKELNPKVEDGDVIVPKTLAKRYRAAKRAAVRTHERVTRAENQIRGYLGNAKTALDPAGQKVCSRSVYEVGEHVRAACTVDKLLAAKTKDPS